MTVREMVAEIQRELRDGSPEPARAREMLIVLSSLLGNINDAIRQAEGDYNVFLMACMDTEEKANRARIKADASPFYQKKREARDTHELVVELIRSLKICLRSLEEELRLAR